MERCRDSKAFIPLASVILILLAVMAMTGCAINTSLITAAYKGQTNVVKDLLDKGADPNERGRYEFGWGIAWEDATPLFCAAHEGHLEAVKVLVDRGADVDVPGHLGWTPLMGAAYKGYTNIAKILVERGADIEGTIAKFKELKRKDAYELLERLAKKQQQPPRYRASPPMLPTALPLPTEPAEPF